MKEVEMNEAAMAALDEKIGYHVKQMSTPEFTDEGVEYTCESKKLSMRFCVEAMIDHRAVFGTEMTLGEYITGELAQELNYEGARLDYLWKIVSIHEVDPNTFEPILYFILHGVFSELGHRLEVFGDRRVFTIELPDMTTEEAEEYVNRISEDIKELK